MHTALVEQWKHEEQQPFAGWDFSYLADRQFTEPPPWSYESLVRSLMPKATSVLDIGTGGGEKLLQFRDVFPGRVAATEGYPPNVRLAREHLGPLGVAVVAAADGLEKPLPFEDEGFDLVINRHAAFNITEVERVLKPGGVFLTQQVHGQSLLDLQTAFDAVPQWPYWTLEFALDRLRATKLVVERTEDWTGRMTFKDVGALVYYLRAVPWTVEGFSVDTHLPYLEQLQARLEREGALSFQWKVFLLQVRK